MGILGDIAKMNPVHLLAEVETVSAELAALRATGPKIVSAFDAIMRIVEENVTDPAVKAKIAAVDAKVDEIAKDFGFGSAAEAAKAAA